MVPSHLFGSTDLLRIMEDLPDGILALDEHWRILYAKRRCS
jgi:hypothetical protein